LFLRFKIKFIQINRC